MSILDCACFLWKNALSELTSVELDSNWPTGEQEAEDFKLANWNDTIASHPKIELHLFHIKFWSTIKKVAECGHSEETAEMANLRCGIYCGCNLVYNIMDNALMFSEKGNESDTSRSHEFEDLHHLVDFTVPEIICVHKELKHS